MRTFTKPGRLLVTLTVFVVLSGASCRRSSPTGAPSPSLSPTAASPRASVAPPSQGECDKLEGGTGTHAYLSEMRVGTHDGFDRVTFQFTPASTPGPIQVPKYQIDSVEPPFTYGPEDKPMEVGGSAFARVIFFGGERFDRNQDPAKRIYTGPDEFRPGFPVLVEAELQEDFEATMSWVLGLSKTSCPTARELTNPSRLVIDLPG